MKQLSGYVKKGWGYEIIWATNEKYAGKILVFEKAGAKMSLHFHKDKEKSWFVNTGKFKLIYCNTKNASYLEKILNEGDTWHNPPLHPHQLVSLVENSMIFEVSTKDNEEDNYRIAPGDSQTIKVDNDGKNDISS